VGAPQPLTLPKVRRGKEEYEVDEEFPIIPLFFRRSLNIWNCATQPTAGTNVNNLCLSHHASRLAAVRLSPEAAAMTGSCLAKLATIAWEVYILCRDAPEEFQSVAEGIVALHTSATLLELQNVHNLAQDRICPLARDSQQSLCAIQAIINRTLCHAYRERDSRILLRERSEQLIRITILFSTASAAITKYILCSI
jgi:hypothetical protein